MPEEGPDELEELIEFLSDSRPQMRQQAVDIVQGLSGSGEGIKKLASRATQAIPPLLRLLAKSEGEARSAAISLVNFTQDPKVVQVILGKGGVERVMERVREAGSASLRGLLVMLLANLAQDEGGARQFLQEGRGELEGFHLATVLRMAQGAPLDAPHAATLAANVTTTPFGRKLATARDLDLLPALAALASCSDRDARAGACRALRNCAADEERHADLVAVPAAVGAALARVNGESPKEMEDDAAAEMVASLAKSEQGRAALWALNGPEVLRKGYEYEENRDVCTAMEATIALLMAQGRQEEDGGGPGIDIPSEGGMVMFDRG